MATMNTLITTDSDGKPAFNATSRPNKRLQHRRQQHYNGFSLIELAVVLVIIAVLARIAYPAYTSTLQKSRRSDAKAGLLDLASREEKYYSMHNQYTANAALLYSTSSVFPLSIQSGSTSYYQLNVSVTPATATAVAAYTASATPTGTQANDLCGTYSLTNLGLSSVSTSVSNCW